MAKSAKSAIEMSASDMQANAGTVCSLLKLMANENRLIILCKLAEGEHSVSALQADIPISQSALSQHLALLRREKLVSTRREAQTIYYSLFSDDVKAIMQTLYERFCRPTS